MSQFEDDGEQLFWEEWLVQFKKANQLMKEAERLEAEQRTKKLHCRPRNRLARIFRKLANRIEIKS